MGRHAPKGERFATEEDGTVYIVDVDGFAMAKGVKAKLEGIQIQRIDESDD